MVNILMLSCVECISNKIPYPRLPYDSPYTCTDNENLKIKQMQALATGSD